MKFRWPFVSALKWIVCCVLIALPGCSTTEASNSRRLPFRVVVAVPVVNQDLRLETTAWQAVGQITLDVAAIQSGICQGLATEFVTVEPQGPVQGSTFGKKLEAAAESGADVLLVPTLRHAPKVYTQLNDSFWPNLLLFAVGGPASWFLADRSFDCRMRCDMEVYNVATGKRLKELPDLELVRVSKISSLGFQLGETRLNFLDRADDFGSYALSLVVPVGFLAREGKGVAERVESALEQDVVARAVLETAQAREDIANWGNVAFTCPTLRIDNERASRFLAGAWDVISTSGVELLGVEVSLGKEAFRPVAFDRDGEAQNGRQRYQFRYPMDAAYRGPVRVRIAQNDTDGTYRTFTVIAGTAP